MDWGFALGVVLGFIMAIVGIAVGMGLSGREKK